MEAPAVQPRLQGGRIPGEPHENLSDRRRVARQFARAHPSRCRNSGKVQPRQDRDGQIGTDGIAWSRKSEARALSLIPCVPFMMLRVLILALGPCACEAF